MLALHPVADEFCSFLASCFECVRSRACVVLLCVSGPLRSSSVKSFQIKATRFEVQSVVREGSRSALAYWYVLCVLRFSLRCCFGLSFVFLVCFSGWVISRLMPAVFVLEKLWCRMVHRSVCVACVCARLHKWTATGVALFHSPAWSPTLHILTTRQILYHSQCGIIAAMKSSKRHAPTLSLVLGQ